MVQLKPIQLKPGFVIDAHGKPEAVVLPLAAYRRLVRYLEDLEDTIDLKRAIHTGRGTVPLADFLARLKRRQRARPTAK